MHEKKASGNIKNAFSVVLKTYKETHLLITDIKDVLEKKGLVSIPNKKSDVTTELSKHIEYPEYWLTRYVSWLFRRKGKRGIFPLAGVSVSFIDSDLNPIEPILVCGVGDVADRKKGHYNYWWFHSAYFNEDDRTEYRSGDLKPPFDSPPGMSKVVSFKIKKPRKYWYKKGAFFSVPLTEVKGQKDLKVIASKLVDLLDDTFPE